MGGAIAIADMPILSMLRTRMEWAQERQRLLAENIANPDTPTFRARDAVAPIQSTGLAGCGPCAEGPA
jgi:flagellar basal-body rod protein FlgB